MYAKLINIYILPTKTCIPLKNLNKLRYILKDRIVSIFMQPLWNEPKENKQSRVHHSPTPIIY